MFSNPHQVDLTPALTFVSSPAREIGRQAAKRLLTRMQQPELAPNRHIITPNLQKAGVGLSSRHLLDEYELARHPASMDIYLQSSWEPFLDKAHMRDEWQTSLLA